MIIADLRNHQTAEAGGTMAKRRNVKDSFGKRVRDEREALGLTQSDMIGLLNERYAIQMSEAAFSKIEIGETKRLHIDLQMAITGILGNDIRYLLTGEEPGTTTAWSEEAEQIARMIDAMLPRSRLSMLVMARNLVEADKEDRRRDIEITRFLQSLDQSLTHLTDSQRSAIADILRNLDTGSGNNHSGYSNGQSAP